MYALTLGSKVQSHLQQHTTRCGLAMIVQCSTRKEGVKLWQWCSIPEAAGGSVRPFCSDTSGTHFEQPLQRKWPPLESLAPAAGTPALGLRKRRGAIRHNFPLVVNTPPPPYNKIEYLKGQDEGRSSRPVQPLVAAWLPVSHSAHLVGWRGAQGQRWVAPEIHL